MRNRVLWTVIVGVLSTAGLIVAVAQDRAVEEFMTLQGKWIVTAAEQHGKPFDAIKGGVLTITDRSFALQTAAGSQFNGELRLNPAASPKQLDFVHAGGSPVWEAIYSADGDLFRVHYVEANGRDKRPTLLASSGDTAGTVIVMRHVTK